MATQYKVQSGDTLSGIAKKYGVNYLDIAKNNNIADPNKIYTGQVLNINANATPTPTTTPTPTAPTSPVVAPTQQQQAPQVAGGGQTTPFDTAKNEGYINGVLYRDHNEYLKAGGGQQAGTTGINSRPTIDVQKLYDQSINTPEIKDAEQAVSNAQDQLDKHRQAVSDAISEVSNDPWLSQAQQTGKIDKIQRKAAADEQNLLTKLSQATDSLNSLKGDAQTKVNIALKQYDIQSTEYQQNLSQFSSLLAAGALTNATSADIASISASTGISPNMIQNIINKQKSDNIKPTVIQSTDDSGNVTVSIIDANTGNIIGKQSLGKIDKSKSGSGSAYSKTADKYLNEALSILNDADTSGQKKILASGKANYESGDIKPDKLLSKDEALSAYNRILALTGDATTAQELMDRAWSAGGYQKWNW